MLKLPNRRSFARSPGELVNVRNGSEGLVFRAALLLGVALVVGLGCTEPHQARLSTLDPITAREEDAMLRHESSACEVEPAMGLVASGLPLACANRTAEGT